MESCDAEYKDMVYINWLYDVECVHVCRMSSDGCKCCLTAACSTLSALTIISVYLHLAVYDACAQLFKKFKMEQIIRQAGDIEFSNMLGRIRFAEQTDDDVKKLPMLKKLCWYVSGCVVSDTKKRISAPSLLHNVTKYVFVIYQRWWIARTCFRHNGLNCIMIVPHRCSLIVAYVVTSVVVYTVIFILFVYIFWDNRSIKPKWQHTFYIILSIYILVCHILKYPGRKSFTAKVYQGNTQSIVPVDHPMRKYLETFKRDGRAWPDELHLAPGMPITILTNISFSATILVLYIYYHVVIKQSCKKVNGASGIIKKVNDKFIEVILHNDPSSPLMIFHI